MAPRYKAGDYDGVVESGVNAILDVLEKGEAAALEGNAGKNWDEAHA